MNFFNLAKKFLFVTFFIFILLLLILVYRAYIIFKPCQHHINPIDESERLKVTNDQIKRLQKAITFPTVSYSIGYENKEDKFEFVKYIRTEFNELESYEFVELELVNNYSLLYTIRGSDSSLKPYLFAAHFDVVPSDGIGWQHEPFLGKLDDKYIYGRGTMDDKASMLSQLEAVKIFLSKTKQQPKRTLYLAYGHDEEITGLNGAAEIAQILKNKNVSLEYVLDEGTMIVEDVLPGLDKPTALISVADKGYLTIKFYVNVTGGHSSLPNSDDSALFILSEAITRLKNKKTPSLIRYGPEKNLLEKLAVNLDFMKRLALTNIWLFAPLLQLIFSKSTSMDALQRTTTAVTIFNGGFKDNVLPTYSEFVVNHRIHSLQSCAEIIEFDLKVINDPRIKYQILDCIEPSNISPSTDVDGFLLIEHATMKLFPEAITTPSIMLGLTDSRFYSILTQNIYKYLPIKLKNEDLKRYHGTNERISVKDYQDMINFYYILLNDTDNLHLNKEMNKQHTEF